MLTGAFERTRTTLVERRSSTTGAWRAVTSAAVAISPPSRPEAQGAWARRVYRQGPRNMGGRSGALPGGRPTALWQRAGQRRGLVGEPWVHPRLHTSRRKRRMLRSRTGITRMKMKVAIAEPSPNWADPLKA